MGTTERTTRDPTLRLAVPPREGEGAGVPKALELAVFALRARIDEEFKITERLDTKGRQMFALAAGFFVVAQAVTFGAFRQQHVSGARLLVLAALAGLAVIALAACGHLLANAEEPDKQTDIDPRAIEAWARDLDDEGFAQHLVVHLREVAVARASVNARRAARYGRLESAARFALIIAAVEIGFAIAFRL